ncbi:hypothetical protein G7Y89_g12264 [Cudoniella acicularis]|uniref:2EXR domain-containing protein n=1 Tax=Cudoniella acicularis TaxID=354080 RepID=A0A8H4RC62_9HELO|nr:hypothetical protein G7Y89_g12264 [Cudoniella acicularis]
MPSPTQTTTFHLFPNLAPELRLKIWRHACLPRTVTVRYESEKDQCVSSAKPPAILHACRESRAEALNIYKLCFGTHSKPARIYFNPHQDTLYLPRHREMGYDDTLRDFKILVDDKDGSLNEIRRVAIEHVDVEVKRPWESYNKAVSLRGFRNLEETILVLCDTKGERTDLNEEVKFVLPKEDLERQLRIWANFRQSFAAEEKLLESVCAEIGTDYEHFSLPVLRLRAKWDTQSQSAISYFSPTIPFTFILTLLSNSQDSLELFVVVALVVVLAVVLTVVKLPPEPEPELLFTAAPELVVNPIPLDKVVEPPTTAVKTPVALPLPLTIPVLELPATPPGVPEASTFGTNGTGLPLALNTTVGYSIANSCEKAIKSLSPQLELIYTQEVSIPTTGEVSLQMQVVEEPQGVVEIFKHLQGFSITQALSLAYPQNTYLLGCRTRSSGENAVSTLRSLGIIAKLDVVELDVTDDESILAVRGYVEREYGFLSVLINNAGIAIPPPPPPSPSSPSKPDDLKTLKAQRESFTQTFNTNITSISLLTNTILPLLRLSPSNHNQKTAAKVINISSGRASFQRSVNGNLPPTVALAYSVSKVAVNALTVEGQKSEVAREGNEKVEYFAVNPGHCRTGLNGFKGAKDPLV